MGLYLCRWENGDFSVVQAKRQTQLNDGGNWRQTFSAIFIAHMSNCLSSGSKFFEARRGIMDDGRKRNHPPSSCRCAFRSN
jgi:hypothetical protein